MVKAYPTFIAKDGEDYLVYVPDMDLYTEGKSIEDAIEMARDAIGLKGISLEDDNLPIPEPSNYENAMKKAKEDTEDFDYSKGLLTMVDANFTEYRKKMDNRMVRRNVTLPSWLNQAADAADLNVSGVLQEALKQRLSLVEDNEKR